MNFIIQEVFQSVYTTLQMDIPTRAFRGLFAVSLGITLLHFLFHPYRILGMDTSIFYMDEKVTLAAWFTSGVYLLAAVIGFLTLGAQKRIGTILSYAGMASFFLMLSLDEYFEIHEYVSTTLKGLVSAQSFLGSFVYFSWIFPLLVFIIFVFMSFAAIARRETHRQRQQLLWTGLLMYGAILVFEIVGGATYGHPIYVLMVGIEEGLEMLSATVFLRYVMEASRLFNASGR